MIYKKITAEAQQAEFHITEIVKDILSSFNTTT